MKTGDKGLLTEPEFAITVRGVKFKERVDGGTSMLEAISKCKNGETSILESSKALSFWWKRTSSVSIIWCFVVRQTIRQSFPQVP
jgi:hypothetical protein